ncbi:putative ARO7-chorismate mutase [Ceraceosorus guamensis]|uniref:Chorismate mutase n=1 Tax=Ceraceosorus guamensis TaxID=1522189 RepID=A0A316VWK1_9BASI|nr:putative ARO7-chorismate mutase [Ceraceosorus guamensis]PWN41996.1 putative ARO7-chorismate mutase [Ceraceosorus guamensis]
MSSNGSSGQHTSVDRQTLLSLDHIRAVLIRLEDTIVFDLIERAQYAHNPPMYAPGAFKELREKENWEASWVEWFLKETEAAHAKVRRFDTPDEYPFTPIEQLPKAILPPLTYPDVLFKAAVVNANSRIWSWYRDDVVPAITRKHGLQADDGQYGSAATRDVEVLSAVSRRIHFGMFVSESKFQSSPADFIEPIRARDRVKLEALITKPAVEAALLVRLAEKAKVYGQDLDTLLAAGKQGTAKIDTEEVVRIYRERIIPETKVVEVDYLLKRLEGLSEEEVANLANRR